jgi:dTDP-4-amino-4,6-dideoxygalactose transaminase
LQPIRIFDPRPQHEALSEALHAAFERVVARGDFILGDEVSAFERGCAEHLGTQHAIGVSSGSDALLLSLRALGIGPGDEVVTTAFTFIASAEAIVRAGATPVFADIDPETMCLDPSSAERLLTPKTRAILYVHLYGNPGSIAEHADLCRRKGLPLIEDACQAFGARSDHRAAGTWGTVGCFSFFPTKPLGGLGDGGLCVTDDQGLAEQLRLLRTHGLGKRGECEAIGGNFRLDALQAALLREKLGYAESWRLEREAIATEYDQAFRQCERVASPRLRAPNTSSWSLYTLRVPEGRQELRVFLERLGVESRIYYPTVLAGHAAIAQRCRCDELTEARRASREVLSIPIYSGLAAAARQRVINGVSAWSGRNMVDGVAG